MELLDTHSMNSKASPLDKYVIRELLSLVALCLEFVSVRSQAVRWLYALTCPVQPVRARSLQRVREDGLALPGLAVSRRSTNTKLDFGSAWFHVRPFR